MEERRIPADRPVTDDCRVEVLENGLRLVLVDLPHSHTTYISVLLAAGSAYETKKNNGISHFAEHLLFATTKTHPTRVELNEAISRIPGECNAQTTYEATTLYFETLPEYLGRAAEILAEMVKPREFHEEVVESERTLVLSEIAGSGRGEWDILRRLFGNSSFGLPLAGTKKTVSRLKKEELDTYIRAACSAERIVVAIAGRLVPSEVESAKAAFLRPCRTSSARLELTVKPPKLPFFRRRCLSPAHCVVEAGFLVNRQVDQRDRIACDVLCGGWGLRPHSLDDELRYSSASIYYFYPMSFVIGEQMVLGASARMKFREQNTYVKMLISEWKKIAKGEFSDAWLERARNAKRFEYCSWLDTPQSLAWVEGMYELTRHYRPRIPILEELSILDGLTRDDIARVASSIMQYDNFFMVYDNVLSLRGGRSVKNLVRGLLEG